MGTFIKTTPEQRAEIVRRFCEGEPRKTIASDFNITTALVSYYARAANAPRRRGNEQDRIDKFLAEYKRTRRVY